ncbi:MAG: hypothetical protein ACT4PO_01255 [Actinomycetota bacterium]
MSTAQVAIVVPALVAVALAVINVLYQLKLNRQTLDHQQKLAVQARVASTYEDMLELVGHTMETVNATKPIFVMGQPPEPPEELDKSLIRKVQARIGVHGSPEVKAILERWSKGTSEFHVEAWKLNEMQGAEQRSMKPSEIKENWGRFPSEQWQVVEGKRKDLHATVRDLEEAVTSEMRS